LGAGVLSFTAALPRLAKGAVVKEHSPPSTREFNERPASEADRRFALLVALMTPAELLGARLRTSRKGRRNNHARRTMGRPDAGEGADRRARQSGVIDGSGLMDHERPVVTKSNEEQVRQGETGRHVRYVLLISLALVIILFLLIAVFMKP
jgi:hypothetical protein